MFEIEKSWQAAEQAVSKNRQQKHRLRAPRPTAAEIENLVASYIAEGRDVTRCPPRFVLPTSNAHVC